MKSDISLPSFPHILGRLRLALWQRRLLRGLIRTAWVTLLVPIGVMISYLQYHQPISWFIWLPVMVGVGSLSLLWSLRPLNLTPLVQRLETRFGFQARLITALEVSQVQPNENAITQRLFHEASQITISLYRRIRLLNVSLWLEIEALIAVTAVFSALLMIDGLTMRVPNATAVDLPAAWVEPRADELVPPNPELYPPPFQEPPAPLTPEQAQAALQQLADGLRDDAMTRSIAEAIDKGDLKGAAEAVRNLSDQIKQMSPESQRNLGRTLQNAARSMGHGTPAISAPLQRASSALNEGENGAAGQALGELANLLEGLGQQQEQANDPSPQTEGSGEQPKEEIESGGATTPEAKSTPQPAATPLPAPTVDAPGVVGQATPGSVDAGTQPGQDGDNGPGQPTEQERLGVEGEPLDLALDKGSPNSNQVLQPSDLKAQAGDKKTKDSPFARPRGNNEALGADPLTYPWEKREVIRRYFTQ